MNEVDNTIPMASCLQEDQELQAIMKEHLQAVYRHGALDVETREYITLAVLTTLQGEDMIMDHVLALAHRGVCAEAIKEVIYHCTPYAGLVRVNQALHYVNKAFKKEGITAVKAMAKVTKEDRFAKGFAAQVSVFSREAIQKNHDNAPADLVHIQQFLSAHCFGDFYTRDGLTMRQRELLTFCIIAALGGCENQLRSHATANIVAGNPRATLVDAITQCQPYIGFPRTLNAINIIKEATA